MKNANFRLSRSEIFGKMRNFDNFVKARKSNNLRKGDEEMRKIMTTEKERQPLAKI